MFFFSTFNGKEEARSQPKLGRFGQYPQTFYEQTLHAKLFGGEGQAFRCKNNVVVFCHTQGSSRLNFSGVEFDKKTNETAIVLYPSLYEKDAHPFDLGNAEYADDNYFGTVDNFTESICKTYEEFTKLYIVST